MIFNSLKLNSIKNLLKKYGNTVISSVTYEKYGEKAILEELKNNGINAAIRKGIEITFYSPVSGKKIIVPPSIILEVKQWPPKEYWMVYRPFKKNS